MVELSGIVLCAAKKPSVLISCVALPRWLVLPIWANARTLSNNPQTGTNKNRFIRTPLFYIMEAAM
jgi:hypothetical protein